jgi:rSAM/selenodomain-associated transferase 1
MRGSCAVAVMGKASVPGRVKTRLIPHLGAQGAARLNTAFLQDVVGNVMAAGHAGIAPYIAFGPAGAEAFFREHLPVEVGLIECSMPNFGDCLYAAIARLLELGHESACVLNADSPTLPTPYLIQAARALAAPGDRAVLGPSTDGGYYLLGLKRAHRRLFDDIEWSTAGVCAQTLARAAELGLPVEVLEPWYDVDDAAGLEQLTAELALREADRDLQVAPKTRAALSSK